MAVVAGDDSCRQAQDHPCGKAIQSATGVPRTNRTWGTRACLKVVKEQGEGKRPKRGAVRWHTPEAEPAGQSS